MSSCPTSSCFQAEGSISATCGRRSGRDLHPLVHEKLLQRMRGRVSPSRARGLAIAAIRETYEETGLFLGSLSAAGPLANEDWSGVVAAVELDLSGLRYFARAITPPGRTRRFDSRFFVANARHIGNLDDPRHPGSGELLKPHWFSFAEALELDLPAITRRCLEAASAADGRARGTRTGSARVIPVFQRQELARGNALTTRRRRRHQSRRD